MIQKYTAHNANAVCKNKNWRQKKKYKWFMCEGKDKITGKELKMIQKKKQWNNK